MYDVYESGCGSRPTSGSLLVLGSGFFLVFGAVFLFLGLSWSGRSSSSLEALALLACCTQQYNACITIDGGRRTIHPPPPLGSSLQLF